MEFSKDKTPVKEEIKDDKGKVAGHRYAENPAEKTDNRQPWEMKASENGTKINDYAKKVLFGPLEEDGTRKSGISITLPRRDKIARVREALLNQGYPLADVNVAEECVNEWLNDWEKQQADEAKLHQLARRLSGRTAA